MMRAPGPPPPMPPPPAGAAGFLGAGAGAGAGVGAPLPPRPFGMAPPPPPPSSLPVPSMARPTATTGAAPQPPPQLPPQPFANGAGGAPYSQQQQQQQQQHQQQQQYTPGFAARPNAMPLAPPPSQPPTSSFPAPGAAAPRPSALPFPPTPARAPAPPGPAPPGPAPHGFGPGPTPPPAPLNGFAPAPTFSSSIPPAQQARPPFAGPSATVAAPLSTPAPQPYTPSTPARPAFPGAAAPAPTLAPRPPMPGPIPPPFQPQSHPSAVPSQMPPQSTMPLMPPMPPMPPMPAMPPQPHSFANPSQPSFPTHNVPSAFAPPPSHPPQQQPYHAPQPPPPPPSSSIYPPPPSQQPFHQQPPQSQYGTPSMHAPPPPPPPPMPSQSGQPVTTTPTMASLIPPWVTPCPLSIFSPTCTAFPHNNALRLRSQISFGAVLRPLADVPASFVPVINPQPDGIVRCRECRTYINPFAPFLDNGARWRCNMCGLDNTVPPTYQCPLDQMGRRLDLQQRPELTNSVVEWVAPDDYMVRTPMPPVFVFAIDVSIATIESGALHTIAATILDTLDRLPGDKRTLVGFLTFDSAVHFYSLRAGTGKPSMWVMSDIEQVYLPQPDGLLVNLDECRAEVEQLLRMLPDMHSRRRDVESAFGTAIQAAIELMHTIGGRLVVFASVLPSIGTGRLANRENVRLLGTDKEHTVLLPDSEAQSYRKQAAQMLRFQIGCDLFALGGDYMDLATLNELCKFTSGQLYYLPSYRDSNPQHRSRLRADLTRTLTRQQGWEAVVRIRASKGVHISDFHGNFSLRSNDLLIVPTIDADKAISFELRNDESVINERSIIVQSALLYTTSSGERRIRVSTNCLPVTSSLPDLYDRVQANALINLVAKQSVLQVFTESFEKARESARNRIVALLRTQKTLGSKMASVPSGPAASAAAAAGGGNNSTSTGGMTVDLHLLPIMVLGLLKNTALREGADVRTDPRMFALANLYTMGVREAETFLRPRLLPLHDLRDDQGVNRTGQPIGELGSLFHTDVDPAEFVVLPAEANLSSAAMRSDSVYLFDNGMEMMMRIGRAAPPALLMDLFGASSVNDIDSTSLLDRMKQPAHGDWVSPCARVAAILDVLRAQSCRYQALTIVKEAEPGEFRFVQAMIEDRNMTAMSLDDFMQFIYRGP